MSQLLKDAQNMLLHIAREAVRSHLSQTAAKIPDSFSDSLNEALSLFVSLHRGSALRGCIGNVQPTEPLHLAVAECAIAAAVNDPRFSPMTLRELDQVTFEISVLSPLELVQREDEIDVGTHGLLITKQQARGLLLPQVAAQYGWDRERFLSETCRKAGLHPSDWKQGATIHRFTAQVFTESKTQAA